VRSHRLVTVPTQLLNLILALHGGHTMPDADLRSQFLLCGHACDRTPSSGKPELALHAGYASMLIISPPSVLLAREKLGTMPRRRVTRQR